MPRPTLVTVAIVLCVAMLGVVAVAATQRALDRKQPPTSTQPQAQPRQQPTVRTITPDTGRELKPADKLRNEAVPAPAPARESEPAAIAPAPPVKPAPTFDVAQVKSGRTVALRSKPGGSVVTSLDASTEFGSPETLSVAARRGRWLGVTSTALPNGKIAWVESSRVNLSAHQTHISIRIDLSRRQLVLRDGRKAIRRLSVGIGRAGSETPTGRFAVTDKLPGSRYGESFYGCCILALSGHQTNTPAGWRGGDRLAIHGTGNPASIGVPSSAGCLHADERSLRVMMRRVPLGTPVFIHA